MIIFNFGSMATGMMLMGLVDFFPAIDEDFVFLPPAPPTEVKFVDVKSEIKFKDKKDE